MTVGLFLFQNDLRLHDNAALKLAAEDVDRLICVYCLPPDRANQYPYTIHRPGYYRTQFLLQSLEDLSQQLERHKQHLHVLLEHPLNVLPTLITRYNISNVYRSEHTGVYERRIWQTLKGRYPYIRFTEVATHTLFDKTELPFPVTELPSTFSQFRKLVSDTEINPPVDTISYLPPQPGMVARFDVLKPLINRRMASLFRGGETEGLSHLKGYFLSRAPGSYKETRDSLDGWDSSTKFSTWLALGCLSPKKIVAQLEYYEQTIEKNMSTEWILFELLWREYFQWYAHCHGVKLFQFKGIKPHGPKTAFYPERFRRWCEGNTPFPLVNALMNQLRQTGYMSNRGRQVVASCLVNELSLDWRYGAGYFEEHLLDYDIASNWGNWQYLAGVGADPKGPRHFNIEKQTELFDPDGIFIRKWGGNNHDGNIDSVDAADWPVI